MLVSAAVLIVDWLMNHTLYVLAGITSIIGSTTRESLSHEGDSS